MKTKVGSKISYLKLHGSDAFIPGIGGLGTTLPSLGKSLSLTMTHSEEGVNLHFGGKYNIEATIPWANVQLAVYAPEDKPRLESVKAPAVNSQAGAA